MNEELLFLLEEEMRFNKRPLREMGVFDEYIDGPLDFLRNRPITEELNRINSGRGLSDEVRNRYSITLDEEVVFWLMIGIYSYVFRDAQSSDCRRVLIDIWERLLSKLSVTTESTVRRFLTVNDKIDFNVGDIWKCPYSLTCTTNEWPLNEEENIYEIHLLSDGETTAKNVYDIYNHGVECNNPEFQVNFPKDTSFRIQDIQRMPNNGTKIIMQEL